MGSRAELVVGDKSPISVTGRNPFKPASRFGTGRLGMRPIVLLVYFDPDPLAEHASVSYLPTGPKPDYRCPEAGDGIAFVARFR